MPRISSPPSRRKEGGRRPEAKPVRSHAGRSGPAPEDLQRQGKTFSSFPTREQRCGARQTPSARSRRPPRNGEATFPRSRPARSIRERAVPGNQIPISSSIPLPGASLQALLPAQRRSRQSPSPARSQQFDDHRVLARRPRAKLAKRFSGRYGSRGQKPASLDPRNYPHRGRRDATGSTSTTLTNAHRQRHAAQQFLFGFNPRTAGGADRAGKKPHGAGRENVQRRQAPVSPHH